MSPPTLSIVIPVYNGEQSIGPLVAELEKALAGTYTLEIVLVNDASPDRSLDACLEAQKKAKCRIKVLDLARNFGEHNAVMAGLHHVTSEYSVIMDDDFQNPPSEVSKLVEKAKEGYDVVYTRYPEKMHAAWRNLGSAFNNAVATVMLKKPRNLYLSSFKLLNIFTVKQILKYEGPYPYLDGLILRVTRRIGVVEVQHADRKQGKSNYTLTKLVRLWMNMFTNFSILPLRLATLLGLLCAFLALVFGIVVVIEWFENPGLPVGWASVAFLLVFFSGVQLMVIGMVGEYVGRIFMLKNASPQFIVRHEYS
jgi:undecaprenyl-phosphate 4-deoxy-4-formamido-L-arabinose transferase